MAFNLQQYMRGMQGAAQGMPQGMMGPAVQPYQGQPIQGGGQYRGPQGSGQFPPPQGGFPGQRGPLFGGSDLAGGGRFQGGPSAAMMGQYDPNNGQAPIGMGQMPDQMGAYQPQPTQTTQPYMPFGGQGMPQRSGGPQMGQFQPPQQEAQMPQSPQQQALGGQFQPQGFNANRFARGGFANRSRRGGGRRGGRGFRGFGG